MSTLHPTTAALLARLRAADVQSEAHRAWIDAGCPDAPEPRFVPTEPGWYWRRDANATQFPPFAAEVHNLPGDLMWRATLGRYGLVTDDGLWLGPVAPFAEPDKAAAARAWFGGAPKADPAPSQPGDAMLRAMAGNTSRRERESAGLPVNSDGSIPHPGPRRLQRRTAEEARKEPMPGDRWRVHAGSHYALDVRDGAKWRVRWSNGDDDAFMADSIGEPGETYLGNFPVDP